MAVGGCLIAGLLAPSAALAHDWRRAPIVPSLRDGLAAHLRDEVRVTRGRTDVFAKVGDSITASRYFLQGLACDEQHLARHRNLSGTIRFFRGTQFPDAYTRVSCGHADSFSRESAAAAPYRSSFWPLDQGEAQQPRCHGRAPLVCEYRVLRPAWAVVMIGTNDAQLSVRTDDYRSNLRAIIARSRLRGVVPVLTTLPPRLDDPAFNARIESYNHVLFHLSRRHELPLVNYWRALQRPQMVNGGMHLDGVHPNVFASYDCDPFCRPVDFRQRGLRYGYNQRNLITLKTLKRLRRRTIR